LHGAEFLQHRPRGQPRRQGTQALLEGDKQAIGDERDEDVGLDAMIELVVEGPDRQIALELLEGLLDLGELDVIPTCADCDLRGAFQERLNMVHHGKHLEVCHGSADFPSL
jgi:hypothetical protein